MSKHPRTASGRVSKSRTKIRAGASTIKGDIGQIRKNLTDCKLTFNSERALLRKTIRTAIGSSKPIAYTATTLTSVSNELGNVAQSKSLFFMGPAASFVTKTKDVVHSKPLRQFKDFIFRKLSDHYDAATAEYWANEIIAELRNPKPWRHIEKSSLFSNLPLHHHGKPFWAADPLSGTPPANTDLDIYPARSGIAPCPATTEYVYLVLRLERGNVPRFADSCGYTYWRPGGWTKPIFGCPTGNSGFVEAVANSVCLRHLSDRMVVFTRTI